MLTVYRQESFMAYLSETVKGTTTLLDNNRLECALCCVNHNALEV